MQHFHFTASISDFHERQRSNFSGEKTATFPALIGLEYPSMHPERVHLSKSECRTVSRGMANWKNRKKPRVVKPDPSHNKVNHHSDILPSLCSSSFPRQTCCSVRERERDWKYQYCPLTLALISLNYLTQNGKKEIRDVRLRQRCSL